MSEGEEREEEEGERKRVNVYVCLVSCVGSAEEEEIQPQ